MLIPQLLYNGLLHFAIGFPLACALYVRFQIFHLFDFASGIIILCVGFLLTLDRSAPSSLLQPFGLFAALALTFLLDALYRSQSARGKSPARLMIVGLAALMAVENLLGILFGWGSRALDYTLSPVVVGPVTMQQFHFGIALCTCGICSALLFPQIKYALLAGRAAADDPALAERWGFVRTGNRIWILMFSAGAIWVFCRNVTLTRYFDPLVGLGSIFQVIAPVLVSVKQSLLYLAICALCLAIGNELVAGFAGESYRNLFSFSALGIYIVCSRQHAEVVLR